MQLRLIATKIASSPQRRARLRQCAQQSYTSNNPEDVRRRKLMVIRDVATRWNSTHAMMQRGLLLRKVSCQAQAANIIMPQSTRLTD